MKISVVADAHLNRTSYRNEEDIVFTNLSFRSGDFMKAFTWIIDYNINVIKPNLLVFPGDVFDNYHPSNVSGGYLSSQLCKLTEAKIPSIILLGNHEVCQTNHALLVLKELKLKNIIVVDQTKIIKFQDVLLLLFPYSLDIEQKKVSMKDAFYRFLEEVQEKRESSPELKDMKSFFFGHFGVKGAVTNKYTVNSDSKKIEKSLLNTNQHDITLDDLEKIGSEYIFLGDYHRHQILPVKNSKAFYTGSIEKTDMSEANEKKGFLYYDSEAEELDKYGKCRFVEYEGTRPMLELSGDYSSIRKQLTDITDEQKTGWNGAIVKLKFVGTQNERTEFENNRQDLEKILKDKINPIYISKQANIVDTEEKNKATEVELEILEKGNLSEKEVLEIVCLIISEKVKDTAESKILCEMANNIYLSSKQNLEGK